MRIFFLALPLAVALAGCCCPTATVESEQQRYENYLDKYEELLEDNTLGRRDRKWLRTKRKTFRKEYKKLPSDDASRLPALSELTGRMQDVSFEASARADARTEETLVQPEEIRLGLGHRSGHIIGKSRKFDTDELQVWMVYRTTTHAPKGVQPMIHWQAKNKDGKYETVVKFTVDDMIKGDEGLLTIHSFLQRDPKILKSWPPGKMRVKVLYGDKKRKSAKFEFVD